MEKIKNIIKYKNPLKIYFNSWKNKSFKEVELKNNKILVNSNEKEKPSYKIKIVKNITVKRPKK